MYKRKLKVDSEFDFKTISKTLKSCLLFFCSMLANAQQLPDTNYSPNQGEPFIKTLPHPVIYVDESHLNFHTISGRYQAFAKIVRNDGFELKPLLHKADQGIPEDAKILVISNAISNDDENDWHQPNTSAFNSKEIDQINSWVKSGGALFLIADHMPFAAAAAELAQSFGFRCYDGFAMNASNGNKPDVFTRAENTLADCELTVNLDSIASFTGQAFEIPKGATSILNLNEKFSILLPARAWEFNEKTKKIPAQGKSQLAYLNYGKGKVVLSGEAAMFTAQLNGNTKSGMNSAAAKQNYKLLLNLVRWLYAKN